MAKIEALTGYGPAAQAEFERLDSAYVFSAAEKGRLDLYLRAVDEMARIDAELRKVSLVTTGSRKQVVVHPLQITSIQHRALVLRLHDALKLPGEAGERVNQPAQTRWQARAAARAEGRRT